MENNHTSSPITEAVILMAGVGSRLRPSSALAKPLVSINGLPLISYVFDALKKAGVRTIHAVLGGTGERVAAELAPLVPTGLRLNPILNRDWQKQNGISVLAAADHVEGPFFLTMGDHLFEFSILTSLLAQADRQLTNLAVDRKLESIFDLEDATKVQTAGTSIRAIGKDLEEYDAIDTGVFLCSTEIFNYLRRALREDDCSLSDGIRLMAADDKVRAIDIRDAWWQDVDTPEMLRRAEEESARFLREPGRRLAEEGISRQS